jgi:hypothetical protein
MRRTLIAHVSKEGHTKKEHYGTALKISRIVLNAWKEELKQKSTSFSLKIGANTLY